jgi:hypothetical protein
MHLNDIFTPLASLSLGSLVGVGFGFLQENARRRHAKREQSGQRYHGWMNVPGSMTRVAMLLVSLALAQFAFPGLFTGGNQWSVSAGVVGGYAWPLYLRFRERRASGV